jgi:hypothetical protein
LEEFLLSDFDILFIQGFLERGETGGTMFLDNLDQLFSR